MKTKCLAILATIAMVTACGPKFSDCSNRLVQSFPSPDGTLKAVVYERNCGSTTGINRQVAILRGKDVFPTVAAMNSFFASLGDPKIEIVWKSTNSITINYELGFNIIRSELSDKLVQVEYGQFVVRPDTKK